MDPNVTWKEFLAGLGRVVDDETLERAWALHGWLERGGFCPPDAMRGGLTRETLLIMLTAFVGYFDPAAGHTAERRAYPTEPAHTEGT